MKQRVPGRRAAKAERAGLPKKKKKPVSAPAAAADASPGERPAPPARWTAAQKRAAKLQPRRRAAPAADAPEEAEAAEEEAAAAPETASQRRRREVSPSQYGSHFAHGAAGAVNDEWQTTQEAWGDVAPLLLPQFARKAVWQPFYYDGACADHLRALGFRHVIHENADFFARCKGAHRGRCGQRRCEDASMRSRRGHTGCASRALTRRGAAQTRRFWRAWTASGTTRRTQVPTPKTPCCAPSWKLARSSARGSDASSRLPLTRVPPLPRHASAGKPFCVLLPSSVVFAKLFRDLLEPAHVQLVLPRRVRVCKTGLPPVPFKFMAWVCYRMALPRDLYLVGE